MPSPAARPIAPRPATNNMLFQPMSLVAAAPISNQPPSGLHQQNRKKRGRHQDQDALLNSDMEADTDSESESTTSKKVGQKTVDEIILASLRHTPRKKPARKRTSPEQLNELCAVFERTDSPSFDIREVLSQKLGMTNREVQVSTCLSMQIMSFGILVFR